MWCCCCRKEPPIVRDIKLMCVGVDGAGKTAILRMLKGEDPRGTLSTNGFSKMEFLYNPAFRITVYDLGGGERIRDIWENYYAEVHGIIFVMDMSDSARNEEAYDCVRKCVTNRHSVGKPLLFVLNNVTNGQVDDVEFANRADLHRLCSENRQFPFVTHTHKKDSHKPRKAGLTTVALAKKAPSPLLAQFNLFVAKIIEHYVVLSEGVRQAELALRIRQEAAKEARKLRLMQLEHAHRQSDIAGLDGYGRSDSRATTVEQDSSAAGPSTEVPVPPSVPPLPLLSPLLSTSDTSASPVHGSPLSSEVFEEEPPPSEARNKGNKVVPSTKVQNGIVGGLRDASIFSVKSENEGSVTMDKCLRVRYVSRMERIKRGMEMRKRQETNLSEGMKSGL